VPSFVHIPEITALNVEGQFLSQSKLLVMNNNSWSGIGLVGFFLRISSFRTTALRFDQETEVIMHHFLQVIRCFLVEQLYC
jgi:hypothetical protein